MSRLYKKCVLASGGMHVLLALILVVCPAFLASNPKPSEVQPITFIPDILNDANFAGGGRPDADRPAARTPTPPAPAPLPAPAPPAPQPKPKVKEAALPEIDNDSLEIAKDKKPTKRKLEISTTPVVRNPKAKARTEDTTAEDRQAHEREATKNRLMAGFDRTLGDIKAGTGQAAKFEGSRGPGGGGPSYAGYSAWVRSVYERAWIPPEDASSEYATVEATVTIARDGTVVSRRIVTRSGDAAVDASVQRTLDRVTTVGRPFPEGAKEAERDYIIPFNVKNKRGTA
jgi:outer membrane biosynthesis protein TonB